MLLTIFTGDQGKEDHVRPRGYGWDSGPSHTHVIQVTCDDHRTVSHKEAAVGVFKKTHPLLRTYQSKAGVWFLL